MKAVYAILHPVTSEVVYIGATTNIAHRTGQHRSCTTQTFIAKWCRSLKQVGLTPVAVELETHSNEWATHEQFWISCLTALGANLLNGSYGGAGSGKFIPEIREKVLAQFRAPERRKLVAKQAAERWVDPEYKERVGAAISKALRADDGAYQRRVQVLQESNNKPENRKAQSIRQSAKMANPEIRAALASSMKKLWADPVQKERMLAKRKASAIQTVGVRKAK